MYYPSHLTTVLAKKHPTQQYLDQLTMYSPVNLYSLQKAFSRSLIYSISPLFTLPSFSKHFHKTFFIKPLKKKTNHFMSIKLHFRKFSFTGKGYRLICSKRNTITFNFGFSHMFYVYNIEIKPYHLSKTKLLFIGLNYFIMRFLTTQFFYVKPLNIFTWRGLRPIKQALRKKVGKVSLYF